MAETIKLTSAHDGFEFSAYHEAPFTPRKGGVIVLQEIFGIDEGIRTDVEMWAKAGYEAIAPSLYDRLEFGFTAHHDPEGLKRGVAHAMALPKEAWKSDVEACRDFLAPRGKVCVVGYCYGGSLTWLSASMIEGLAAASSYYGSLVQQFADLPLKCPTIVHFGHTDPMIPADEAEAAIKAAHPDVPVYIYEGAGHGFNNPSPERYQHEAADLARRRTLDLFDRA
jgi:carboxymethylenebutenolidase